MDMFPLLTATSSRPYLFGAAVTALLAAPLAAKAQSVDELQLEIRKRDAQINQLLRRMDALEREVRAKPPVVAPPAQRTAETPPPAIAPPAVPRPAPAPPPAVVSRVPAPTDESEDTMIMRAL